MNRQIAVVVCAAAFSIMTGTLLAFLHSEAPTKVSQRTLTFAERVAYQRAIEDVYWRRRIWPKERTDSKPSLDAVVSQATIEQKVQDYLRHSELLEQEWQKPITPEQLQAEIDRMAQHTKQPEVLRELFAALGNDPFVIAECLARPVLSERMIANFYAHDKEPLDFSQARPENQMPKLMAVASANYTVPTISDAPNGCIDDTWTATTISNAPSARHSHTAVWTGSEMIVWGGVDTTGHVFNSGGRYNPSTDSWTATSTANAPAARSQHTAVWTGSEMIVWGGVPFTTVPPYPGTGGRYNPITNSWTAISTTNAPLTRRAHTAIWTGNGNEMIIWGGNDFLQRDLNTGGRYNPSTDSWTATSTTNAPSARGGHTAVWTGGEMIVWGGGTGGIVFNTGRKYNPSTNSWTATSTTNAPSARGGHTAVWTGSEMIVWGGAGIGVLFNTGGRYDPSTNTWTATDVTNAPEARVAHTAVWTGSEMIVWGGFVITSNQVFNTGGRYCAQSAEPIRLSAVGRKVNGINTARLTWSGANSTNIDVYRDGNVITTVPNTGRYTDSTGETGRARYTYKVCQAGTQTCSNNVRVTFQQ
jgi:N-acetylneuraminic acid mutarotase